MAPIDGVAALAAAIPGAEFKTLAPGPHGLIDDTLGSATLDFVTGRPSAAVDDRVLKTVLFTDIVSSTELLSARGDAQWRQQLDAHDRLVDSVLMKYSGSRVKHTGDGVFALLDGPTKAARCALELAPALAARGISIRAGIHVGECEPARRRVKRHGGAHRRPDRRDRRIRRSAHESHGARSFSGLRAAL
jgi:class 3 adenylate cyclase